jgi:hypothetical protein
VRNTKKSADPTILKQIITLAKIHEILCKAAHRTNLNYNIQMLPSLAHQFFISLYSIFYYYWMVHQLKIRFSFVKYIISFQYSSKPFSALCWLGWGFLKTYEIIHVAVACHFASEEVYSAKCTKFG